MIRQARKLRRLRKACWRVPRCRSGCHRTCGSQVARRETLARRERLSALPRSCARAAVYRSPVLSMRSRTSALKSRCLVISRSFRSHQWLRCPPARVHWPEWTTKPARSRGDGPPLLLERTQVRWVGRSWATDRSPRQGYRRPRAERKSRGQLRLTATRATLLTLPATGTLPNVRLTGDVSHDRRMLCAGAAVCVLADASDGRRLRNRRQRRFDSRSPAWCMVTSADSFEPRKLDNDVQIVGIYEPGRRPAEASTANATRSPTRRSSRISTSCSSARNRRRSHPLPTRSIIRWSSRPPRRDKSTS